MTPSRLAALAALVLSSTPALAQGTAEQRAACTGDAWRLCRSEFLGGVEAITACMKRERDQLGQACRTVMDKAEGTTREAAAPAKPPAAKQAAEAPKTAAPTPPAPVAAAPVAPAPAAAPPPSQQAAAAPAATRSPDTAPAAAQPAKPDAAVARVMPPARPAQAQAQAQAAAPTAGKAAERAAAPRRTRQAALAQRPTRHLAAARPASDEESDIREADQWLREFGLGNLASDTMRGVRRFEALFDDL